MGPPVRTGILGLQEHVMKKFLCVMFVVVSLVVGTGNVFASGTASANATADIVEAIGITKDVDLAFGGWISPAAAATVEIGTASDMPTSTLTQISQIAPSRAQFTVTGTAGYTYDITLPASVTLSSGSNTMTVDTFTCSKATEGTASISSTPAENVFYVGATLNVAASQAAGAYTNTFDVTVAYN